MKLVVIGTSHKFMRVNDRERFFLRPAEREYLFARLKNEPSVMEAFVLSTCNRTEIYAQLIDERPDVLFQALAGVKNMSITPELRQGFYVKTGPAALEHLFHVACGLDSLVIGETQILGQLKQAVALARDNGMMGRDMNILADMAVRAGKLAQLKTQISAGGSSVSWAAVAMAQDLLGAERRMKVLIIGAGKMSQLTASQLSRKNVPDVFVMNRTFARAAELAEKIGARAVAFWEVKDVLLQVDVCICSSGAPHYLVEPALIERVMAVRAGRPLLLIDISTPRNIDPGVAAVAGVRLLSIDDLQKVVDENIGKRRAAIDEVRAIIRRKISAFHDKIARARKRELRGPVQLAAREA
jgi:glutamyl-tRNA reductase